MLFQLEAEIKCIKINEEPTIKIIQELKLVLIGSKCEVTISFYNSSSGSLRTVEQLQYMEFDQT